MSRKTIEQLYAEHDGKVSDKWSLYLSEYGKIFKPYRNRSVSLLEIGVQNGGSLEIWSKYFKKAKRILGCDVDPKCTSLRYDDPRIVVIVGDVNSDAVQAAITEETPALDIIIDDASHHSKDVVLSFSRYFPHLAEGGVYIVEDLHTSYWQKFGGGLFHPYSSIMFFKHLTDIVNNEHWGIEKAGAEILKGFFRKYGFHIEETILQSIHSIKFINSLCVIRKAKREQNRIGKRIVAGRTEKIMPGYLELNGLPYSPDLAMGEEIDQIDNEWATRSMPPSEELIIQIQEFKELELRTQALNEHINALDHEIQQLEGQNKDQVLSIHGFKKKLEERDLQVEEIQKKTEERDLQIMGLQKRLEERELELQALSAQLAERLQRVEALSARVAEREEEVLALTAQVAERDGQIASLNQAVAERGRQIASLKAESVRTLSQKDGEIGLLRGELNRILHSRSWRLTAPLRTLAASFRSIVRKGDTPRRERIPRLFRIRRYLALMSEVRQIRRSSLFDADYYLSSYPDVRNAGMDPAKHYCSFGWREHRNPSAAFSTSQYLLDNPDIAQAKINPLLHYLRHGQREGRPISAPASSSEAASATGVAQPDSVSHWESTGVTDSPAAQGHASTSNSAIDAEVEAIRNSGLFDESFYLSMYMDLHIEPRDAIRHYCEVGWREGRNPSDDFETQFYLETYSDIRNAGMNPFYHYVVAGASEHRQALPESATGYENDIWFGVVDTDIKLIAFYAPPDWATVRRGRPMFKGHRQPLLPHEDLGFYDPADWHVLQRQADLARHHGLYGFCFELGSESDRLRHLPNPLIESVLSHAGINFRFCARVELDSTEVPGALLTLLARAASDPRYIRIANRPVIIVNVQDEQEDAGRLLTAFKSYLATHDIRNAFLIGQREPAATDTGGPQVAAHCDAALELPRFAVPGETGNFLTLNRAGAVGDVFAYSVVASHGVTRAQKATTSVQPLYQAVSLGRDNTASGSDRPVVYTRFTVRDYRRWLDAAIAGARIAHPEDRRFVFVNAWNAWNEGLVLEPDPESGFARVNETTRALMDIASDTPMPKVSVIVPNYNHEPFLRRRLDSIYGQTYKNIEVILLDDCSSDQSRSLMDRYAAANADITRTLYNDDNSGSAFRQWAKGIKAARGDLVWIAESDDYCDDRFLEMLVRCFDDEAVVLAYSKCVFVDRDEVPMQDEFQIYVSDLECADKWNGSYVETAHNEVRTALGMKNTIPNASGVLFKRPIHMPLLEDESWLSMSVAGDWVFYLHIIRGGRIAYNSEATNFFRRYEGSTAEVTYKEGVFYREVGMASRTVAALYNVPLKTLEQCRKGYRTFYEKMIGQSDEEFALWYDYESILQARENRLPNVMVSTMGFFPGGAEILPIRLVNEFKRQGLSVLLLNAGLMCHEDRINRMLRNDVPVVETSRVEDVKAIIHEFGVEVLNTHQWHIQKYPLRCSDVFDELQTHIASLHGMIEHGDAFGATSEQLREVDRNVGTWVYTAEKNLKPFSDAGLFDESSSRFVKIPNGMQPPEVVPVPRADMSIPEDAFALCCVSRAIPEKGWAETILAVERARRLSGRDIRLILVGNGPVYEEYCRVGVSDFVYLAGFNENSVGHYAAADMGIMLTKFKSESFPLTVVDCLFAGRPYIASDVGDIRNMLTTPQGIAGEVIELENWEVPIEKVAQVIAAFATDSRKYKDVLALVEEVAHRYRIDVVARQYVRLFESSSDEHRLRSSGRRN
jgi:glycosyltransferase involved in cell wall biosynthesis